MMRLLGNRSARVGRRHKWGRIIGGEKCVHCAVERYVILQNGGSDIYNYEWPDGRKKAIPINGPRSGVPPCEVKR